MFKNSEIAGSNIDPAVYRRTDQPRCTLNFPLTRSDLVEFVSCPRRYRNGYVRPETKALKTGNLYDPALLQPDTFSQHFVECPVTYESTGMSCPQCGSVTDAKTCRSCKCERVPVKITKEWNWAASECQAFKEANKGREPVEAEKMAEVRAAVTAIHEESVLHFMLENSERQVMVIADYTDESSGLTIPVKCLIDIVPSKERHFRNDIWDYKTSRCVAPSYWEKIVLDYNYHVQAAWNLDMFNAATGEDRNTFRHLAQETIFPFHFETQLLSGDYVQAGREFYIAALRKYCHCLKHDVWPGYFSRVVIDGSNLIQPNPSRLMYASEAVLDIPQDPEQSKEPDAITDDDIIP